MDPGHAYRQRAIAFLFDVNRTILIEDRAAGKSTEDELATIVASTVLGNVSSPSPSSSSSTSSPTWVAVSPSILHSPVKEGALDPQGQPLVSFYKFVQDVLFPFPHLSPTLAPAQKKEQIEAVKAKRRALLKQFVQPGQPGQRYAAEYATLLAQVLPLGAFVLLRSFYELILHAEQSGRPFALCFRTFGEDLETIFAEWNAFCDSKHPLFPAYCSNAASLPHRPDRRLTHAQVGAFVRYGSLPSECCLVMGTHRQPSLADLQRQTIEEFYQGHNVSILRGFPEIDGFLQAAFRAQRTLALRDYYPWWAANSERYDSGKLVFIPEQDSDPERPLVRYFDDNLRAEELVQKKQLIADLRDPSTGRPHSDPLSLFGQSVIQADPLRVITERDYFIKEAGL